MVGKVGNFPDAFAFPCSPSLLPPLTILCLPICLSSGRWLNLIRGNEEGGQGMGGDPQPADGSSCRSGSGICQGGEMSFPSMPSDASPPEGTGRKAPTLTWFQKASASLLNPWSPIPPAVQVDAPRDGRVRYRHVWRHARHLHRHSAAAQGTQGAATLRNHSIISPFGPLNSVLGTSETLRNLIMSCV